MYQASKWVTNIAAPNEVTAYKGASDRHCQFLAPKCPVRALYYRGPQWATAHSSCHTAKFAAYPATMAAYPAAERCVPYNNGPHSAESFEWLNLKGLDSGSSTPLKQLWGHSLIELQRLRKHLRGLQRKELYYSNSVLVGKRL
jgi:hypothetical protein